MDYITVDETARERLAFEVIVSLPVDQFENALLDGTILLAEEQLRGHLNVLEQDHVRHSVRAKVAQDAGPATNAGLLEDLERRIEAVKERLGITE